MKQLNALSLQIQHLFAESDTIPGLHPNSAEKLMQRHALIGLSCMLAGFACIAASLLHLVR